MNLDKPKIPVAPLILGFAGLIPFVFPAVWMWTQDSTALGSLAVVELLRTYAALILSFMGAIHWGFETAEQPAKPDFNVLCSSVSPALYAWMCLVSFNSSRMTFLALAAGFAMLFLYDFTRRKHARLMPGWYIKLRIPLTLGAILSLIAAAAA